MEKESDISLGGTIILLALFAQKNTIYVLDTKKQVAQILDYMNTTGWLSYRIAKCIRELTRGSIMCSYLMANDLIYDEMNTQYKVKFHSSVGSSLQCDVIY